MSGAEFGVLLASGGDTLNVWDGDEGYTGLKQFNPHSARISNLCWARDDSFIASASSGGDKVYIASCTDSAQDFSLAEQMHKTCLAVCSQSKNLMAGGSNGSVHIWDVRSRKLKKSIQDHSAWVTSVAFNCNDSLIASGSTAGELHISNLITGQKSRVLGQSNGKTVRQVRFSQIRKSVLGHVDDTGAVCIWDAGTRVMTQKYESSHQATATGLSFSPLNHMLMMSIGLDKAIICYDVTSKKTIKTIHSDAPLTSVDFLHDGATLAVGTSQGHIHVYDLRSFTAPLRTIHAHKSPVVCVGYRANSTPMSAAKFKFGSGGSAGQDQDLDSGEPLYQDISAVMDPRKQYATDSHTALPTNSLYAAYGTRSNITNMSNTSHADHSTTHSRDDFINSNYQPSSALDVSEIFSPVREESGTQSQPVFTNSGLVQSSRPHPSSNHDDYVTMSVLSPAGGTSDLFSPVQQTLDFKRNRLTVTTPAVAETSTAAASTAAASTAAASTAAALSFAAVPVMPKLPAPNSLNGYMTHQTVNSVLNQITPRPASAKSVVDQTREDGASVTGLSHDSSLHNATRSTIKSHNQSTFVLPSSSVDLPSAASTSLPVGPTEMETQESACSQDAVAAVGTAEAHRLMPTEFQTEFVLRMVRDELEEFREEMRMTQLSMHMDMLKQFQLQQAELKSLVETYSINHELLAEVHRLRAENERLKKTF